MNPKLILFDCANTLIWTDWKPQTFAVKCAKMAGLSLPDNAAVVYLNLFLPKLPEFHAMNRLRSLDAWRQFWVQHVADWLTAIDLPSDNALQLHMIGEREIFEVPSSTFKRFDDAAPCLERLKARGYQLAVLSNWDHSLHKCLEAQGLSKYFDAVFASLEEGVEKPDPGLFQIALDHFGVSASEAFHVGDDPVDDLKGAQNMGIPVALLDRTAKYPSEPVINTLNKLEEALEWYA